MNHYLRTVFLILCYTALQRKYYKYKLIALISVNLSVKSFPWNDVFNKSDNQNVESYLDELLCRCRRWGRQPAASWDTGTAARSGWWTNPSEIHTFITSLLEGQFHSRYLLIWHWIVQSLYITKYILSFCSGHLPAMSKKGTKVIQSDTIHFNVCRRNIFKLNLLFSFTFFSSFPGLLLLKEWNVSYILQILW